MGGATKKEKLYKDRNEFIEHEPDTQCVNSGSIFTSDGNGSFVIMDSIIKSDCAAKGAGQGLQTRNDRAWRTIGAISCKPYVLTLGACRLRSLRIGCA